MLKKALLSLSIEFGPIIVFSILSEKINFILATGIFVILTIIAFIAGLVERKKIAWFPLIVAVLVVGFGLLTVVLKNPFFIIIKDTLYNGVFALILFVGLMFNKGLLKPLFDSLFAMTEEGWRILSFRWAIMFVLLTVGNEIARANLNPTDWVNYKILATIATAAFSLYQFKLSKKYRLPNSTEWGMVIID